MQDNTTKDLSPMEESLLIAGQEIEKLMDYYPCLRELCCKLRTDAYPAALFVGAAFLGTLMTRCSYSFYHRPEELRRLNYCIFIIGDPGSGKSFAERLYKVIADPIIRQTKVSTNAINRYKRKYKQWKDGGCKGDGPVKPKMLVRTHPSRTSNRVFIEDMMNAIDIVDGEEMHLHMLSFDSELDNAINMQGEAWNNKTFLELKAFHNEEDGQFYTDVDSLLCNFNVYWNYVYTGTPLALRHKVNASNIGNGLSTRLACIPMPKSHFQMIEYEEYDPEKPLDELTDEEKTLRMWAERLDKVHGELPIRDLVKCTWQWTANRMEDAKEDDSEADETMCKRVAYYGINVSMPFIMMRHWEEWNEHHTITIDETDERLCRLVMNIQYMCQRHFFGRYWDKYYEQLEQPFAPIRKRHTKLMKNRYWVLPEQFSVDTVMIICGVKVRNAEKMIERWHNEHYIERIGFGLYRKIHLELT